MEKYSKEKNDGLKKAFLLIALTFRDILEDDLLPKDKELHECFLKINKLLAKFSKRMTALTDEKNVL